MRRVPAIAVMTFFFAVAVAHGDVTIKRLAPGITLTQEIDKTTPLVINVLTVDLDAPGVHIGVGIGQDRITGGPAAHGREDVSRYTQRHHVLAAVNGDFFPYTGDPLGVGISDGELFSEPWVPTEKIGPRVGLGIAASGRSVAIDVLGFLGDLQTQDGSRTYLNGIDRAISAGEIVAYTPTFGVQTANKVGGTEVIVQNADLPVRADKLIGGEVQQVIVGAGAPALIPSNGFVLSGAPGAGADFLATHVHAGDRIGFVLAVAPIGRQTGGIQIASLPRTDGDLPSRAGSGIIDRAAFFWASAQEAIGGGPRLLVNGQIQIDGPAEGFNAGFIGEPNPRTAVGVTHNGRHLIIVAVDGRQSISRGVTLSDLALILKRYGAWNAMNLDGGGSTCMAVGGLVVSSPEGSGTERPVADMLLVESDRPTLQMPTDGMGTYNSPARLALPTKPILVGTATPIKIAIGDQGVPGTHAHILWQGLVTNGIGFINQRGYFIAEKAGTGTVTALYNGRYLTGQITVQATRPTPLTYALHGDFAPDPSGAANRSQLTVRVLDSDGKPLPNTVITLSVRNGTADSASVQTDADGTATIGITWTASDGGSVLVSSGVLTPVALSQPVQEP